MLGPLGVLALVLGSKKKKSKVDVLLFMLVFAVITGMTIISCGPPPADGGGTPSPQSDPTQPSNPPTETQTPVPASTDTATPSPTSPPAPTGTPSLPDCPPANYNYDCSDSGDKVCINRLIHNSVEQIAHTIYGEGGAFGGWVGANILQTVVNRAYIYWEITHHGNINPNNIPWRQMNRGQFENLILFILSEDSGNGHPAYNAWEAPYPHSGLYWNRTIDAVNVMLDDAGAAPQAIKLKLEVMFRQPPLDRILM